MRLRLFDWLRGAYRRHLAPGSRAHARTGPAAGPARPARPAGARGHAGSGKPAGAAAPGGSKPAGPAGSAGPAGTAGSAGTPGPGSHRRVGPARAVPDPGRRASGPAGPVAGQVRGGRAAARTAPRRWGVARAAIRSQPAVEAKAIPVAQQRKAAREAAAAAGRPWYEVAQSNRTAAGRRHCGRLEEVVCREWAEDAVPPPEIVRAIDRLAELPQLIKEKLAAGLDAIYVGAGGVPDLDDMSRLSGVPLPSGRATWDACAGAYGERKIIVGSRPSPSPDVMCHEIGHALDDIDGSDGQWQSDSAEFRALYEQCVPHMVSDFHQQGGILGRREFFADAFAAIASRQRPALVDMLGGDTRAALNVMLYFNVRYGI
jgi:hypothetical protein